MTPFIVTFYSYKGGVGRSILAANVAALLARSGKTLLWDLDIEAPGLHRITDLASPQANERGFFECLLEWQTRNFDPLNAAACKKLGAALLPVERRPNLHLLPAHGAEARFAHQYQEIKWQRFLADEPSLGIQLFRTLIDWFASDAGGGFRYIVLDSRTGITDIGGLLAAVLPHVTVLVGNYGAQNTGGLSEIWKALQPLTQQSDTDRDPLPPLRLQLVASPISADDPDVVAGQRNVWRDYFRIAAETLVEIPESPRLRLREAILALTDAALDDPVVSRYEALTRRLQEIDAEQRQEATLNEQAERERIDTPDKLRRRSTAEQGKRFEDTTATLLRMLGYTVEPEQSLDGMRIDLVATLRQGLEHNTYLVECKDHRDAVGVEVVTKLHAALQLAKARSLGARGMIVARRFSPQSLETASSLNIRCLTHDDLERALIDFSPYLNRLVSDFASSPLATCYVDQRVAPELSPDKPEDLLAYALRWAQGDGSRLWVLLGDYGTGKTAFTRRFAYELAQLAIREQSTAPFPLLINLRDWPTKASLADVLHDHWHARTGERRDPAVFLHLLARGRLVLILDSFDEMGVAQAYRNVVEQFRGLVSTTAAEGDSRQANRILITCRDQFFRDREDAARAVAGHTDTLAPLEQAARAFAGRIDLLPRFDDTQIKDYLLKRLGPKPGAEAWTTINRIYNLKSLADRPQLIEIIIGSLPRLSAGGSAITAGALYLEYTNAWLDDPSIRPAERQSSSDELRCILETLALELWRREGQQIHYRDLSALVARPEVRNGRDPVNLDVELRTAAFLSRTPDGYYRFSHRSFLEFFLARALLRAVQDNILADALARPPLSLEVCQFVADLMHSWQREDAIREAIHGVLLAHYRPQASENALRLGYRLDRHDRLTGQISRYLPTGARLHGARLAFEDFSSISLPEADLREADLFGAQFAFADLSKAHLDQATLDQADLEGCILNGTSLVGAHIANASLTRARAIGAKFGLVHLAGSNLCGIVADGSDWSGAFLCDVRLADSRLSGADLESTLFTRVTAPRAQLPDSTPATLTCGSPAQPHPLPPIGHSALLSACAFSPDGQFVLTAAYDNSARLWDARSGEELRCFEGHTGGLTSCAFSPDGRFVLTAADDNSARLWDTRSGAEIRHFEGHTGGLTACAFSPDGKFVLTASWDTSARLWDTYSGVELQRFGHTSRLSACAFSPDGLLIVTAADDNFARLWDTHSGEELRCFEGHSGWLSACAFSPDGLFVLTAAWDSSTRLWDTRSGAEVQRFEGHAGWLNACAFSPDGLFVLTAAHDNSCRLWDARTGAEIRRFNGHSSPISACVFSPDGRFVLTAAWDDSSRLWDTRSGVEIRRFEGHTRPISACAFSPDGLQILTANNDHSAHLWDAFSGAELRSLDGHTGGITACVFSPDGLFVLTASDDHSARLWDTYSGAELQRFDGHTHQLSACAFSPDGLRVLTAAWDNSARLWDTHSGAQIKRLDGHTDTLSACAFSPDGQFVLTASDDRSARLWDPCSGAELHRLEGHSGPLTACTFSPDGQSVLTAARDNSARLWDANSGVERQRFEGHTGPLSACAFSPDGHLVLTVAEDNSARLWNTYSGIELRCLHGHIGPISACTFSPNGQLILTTDGNSARIWDTRSGTEIRRSYQSDDGWLTLDVASCRWQGKGLATEAMRYVDLADCDPVSGQPHNDAPRWAACDLPELQMDSTGEQSVRLQTKYPR